MQTLYIHPDNPQPRLISQAIEALNADKLIVYPTEISYAFGCKIGSKNALQQLKRIRQLDDTHQFTLLCQDLSEISTYASVDNQQFKWLKASTPAPITFILPASKEVPKKLAHPKKRTIGIRVPSNPVAQAILTELDEPLLTSSLVLPEQNLPLDDPFDIEEKLSNHADMLINTGVLTTKLSTILDMTDYPPALIRQGAGDVSSIIA